MKQYAMTTRLSLATVLVEAPDRATASGGHTMACGSTTRAAYKDAREALIENQSSVLRLAYRTR
ncbi:MAG: hypothetical protein R3F58_01660 [Steroidobacteraceae bacterium]